MSLPWWRAALVVGIVAFSGCLTDGDGGDPTTSPSPTASATGTATATPTSTATASPTASPTVSPTTSPSPSPSPSNGTNTSSPSPSPTPPRLPVTWSVKVVDNDFQPDEVTLQRGDSIRWEHIGFAKHDLKGAGWESHPGCPQADCFEQNEKFTHRFTAIGTEVVYCPLHGGTATGQGMAMRVIVKERHDDTP